MIRQPCSREESVVPISRWTRDEGPRTKGPVPHHFTWREEQPTGRCRRPDSTTRDGNVYGGVAVTKSAPDIEDGCGNGVVSKRSIPPSSSLLPPADDRGDIAPDRGIAGVGVALHGFHGVVQSTTAHQSTPPAPPLETKGLGHATRRVNDRSVLQPLSTDSQPAPPTADGLAARPGRSPGGKSAD